MARAKRHYLFGVVSKGFVDKVKHIMGTLASGRKTIEAGEAYQLREPVDPYNAHFEVKKGDIELENAYFGNVNL
jgi:REP-associated tyrosine transposase